MKKYLTLLIFFFLPFLSYAQIVIEERVEVDPQQITADNPTSGMEPIFTYILTWPPDQYRRGKIQIISCYGDTTDTGWTSGGYATTTMPGRGHHIFNFINQRWYYDSNLGWGWYYDGNPNIERKVLVNDQELNIGSTLGSTMGTIDTPLLDMENFICDSGFVKLDVVPTRWADCDEIGWFPTDPITLRFIQGEEFASFFNIKTGTDLGNIVQIDPFVRIEDLHFFFGPSWDQDGLDDIVVMPIDSNYALPFTVVVEANINEVTFSDEIEFIPKSFIIETELYPQAITTGEQSAVYIYLSALCSGLPFETKINVEIIQGQVYGSLIDPNTNERTKIVTNLEHFFGNAWVDYIADGISSEITDTVIVRISTTDPAITPKETLLIIKPPPIYVYTEPEVLGADDTADVIIKHRLENGTLEDFPPEQTFELAVLDGCVNGNFMVGDSINVYFADAVQPIKFVTADSLDSEVGEVFIRVGTDLSGFMRPVGNLKGEEEKLLTEKRIGLDTLRAGFEKMIAEKQAEAEVKKKENNEPPLEAPIVTACTIEENMIYQNYWRGFTSVDDGVCSILPKCSINNDGKKPVIELIDLPNGYFGVDFCLDSENIKNAESGQSVLGGYHEPCWSKGGEWIIFKPQYWLFIRTPDRQIYNDFELELCYDDYSNVVQFGITDDMLFFKSIVGFCGNLIELAEKIMINDTSEIRTKIPQDEQTLLNVFNDLEKSKTYGIRSGLYYFTEITWAHELQHKENFKTQILKFYNDNYGFLNYSKFDVSCEDAGSINSVKNQMKQNYKNALEEYEKLVKIRYYEKYYGKNGENKEWNETTNTHNKVSVQSVIEKLQDKVADLLYELIYNNH